MTFSNLRTTSMAWQPIVAWGVLFGLATAYEAWAITKPGPLTLSEGVWAVTRRLAQSYPYALTLLGLLIGTFVGHLLFCPCELR